MAAMLKLAAILFRELSRDGGASGLNDKLKEFGEACLESSGQGVGAAIVGIAGAATGVALTVLGFAALLLGPALWQSRRD